MNLDTGTVILPSGFDPQSQVSDLSLWDAGGNIFLVAAFEGNSALVSFQIFGDGIASQSDVLTLPGTPAVGGGEIGVGPNNEVMVTGPGGVFAQLVSLGSDGALSSPVGLDLGDVSAADFTTAVINGTTYVYASDGSNSGIQITRVGNDGASTELDDLLLQDGEGAPMSGQITDLAVVHANGADWLIASVAGDNAIVSLEISADGTLAQSDIAGASEGLGLNTPEVVETFQIGPTGLVLAASTGSSSVSVLMIDENGVLTPLDHVVDSASTRFDDVTAMSVVEVAGDHFVLVGGGDGGVSLLQVLPTGRLVHRQTIVDIAETTLQSVGSVAAIVNDGTLQVFVSSQTESGITMFEMDVADLGETLVSVADGATLSGSASDDVLVSTGMDIVATGGGGADQFVFDVGLDASGHLGTVSDFEVGLDKIVFPQQIMLRSLSQISFTPISDGVILEYGSISLTVKSADGGSLDIGDFSESTFFDLEHHYVGNAPDIPLYDPDQPDPIDPNAGPTPDPQPPAEPDPDPINEEPPEVEGVRFLGTGESDRIVAGNGADTIDASSGSDTIYGNGGADYIVAGNGPDLISGGAGNDTILGGGDADDRRDEIFAGSGHDFVDGGHGNDLIYGESGDDLLIGGFGADRLIGQTGADTLSGGPLSDMIFGGDGSDFINGGFGHDRLNGGDGGDQFFHLGISDHGSDWIQDFDSAEGDVLLIGIPDATLSDFRVNFAETENAGQDGVAEAFVIYKPTGQIVWALVDGEANDEILIQFSGSSETFDLLG